MGFVIWIIPTLANCTPDKLTAHFYAWYKHASCTCAYRTDLDKFFIEQDKYSIWSYIHTAWLDIVIIGNLGLVVSHFKALLCSKTLSVFFLFIKTRARQFKKSFSSPRKKKSLSSNSCRYLYHVTCSPKIGP